MFYPAKNLTIFAGPKEYNFIDLVFDDIYFRCRWIIVWDTLNPGML